MPIRLPAIAALFGALALAPVWALPAPEAVRFTVATEAEDRRFVFATRLLSLALEKSDGDYVVVGVGGMNQRRAIGAADRGEVDVAMLPHLAPYDTLLPVRRPLRRGLLGVRLLVANPEIAEALMVIPSLAVLKRDYVMGYGNDWLDGDILRALGFQMEFGSSYAGLFDMLRAGRFDYLSRGVNELGAELGDPRLAGSGMVVVPGIALFYPLDDFFFITPSKPALRDAIDLGFQRAIDDGSYALLFEEHFSAMMRAAKIEERSIIHVNRYPVPAGTRLELFDVLQPTESIGVLVDTLPAVGP